MTSIIERKRRARKMKRKIDLIRGQGNKVIDIADCLEISRSRFYSYAEGVASPKTDEDYNYIMTSLDMLIDKPLPKKEPKQQELFPAVVQQQDDAEVTDLLRKVAELKARNEYLESTIAKMREALG